MKIKNLIIAALLAGASLIPATMSFGANRTIGSYEMTQFLKTPKIRSGESDLKFYLGTRTLEADLAADGMNIITGDSYQINNTSVLNATTLGSGVLASSLTSLGTIASLVATTANIDAGTIDGTAVGASSASTGKFTTLETTGTVIPPLGFLETFGEGADKGFMTLQLDGTAEDGTANVHNVIHLGNGHKINYVAIVAQTATIAMTANGLNIGLDQTALDGAEFYVGINGASGRAAIIGTTPAFEASITFQIADVSGTDDFHFGFRRAETVNATFDDYLDVASIGCVTSANPMLIQLETILNNQGTTTTNTTDTLADATSIKFTVKVSSAGVVTYLIDGVAPSTTATFTFDDGDLVIPFIHYLQHADLTGDFDIEEFEYASQ